MAHEYLAQFVGNKRRAWASLRTRAGSPPKPPDQNVVGAVSLPLRAGDLLLFHLRLSHRATQPKDLGAAKKREKLAVFLVCSRNNPHARAYRKFIAARPDYGYLKTPDDPAILAEAGRAGLTLL